MAMVGPGGSSWRQLDFLSNFAKQVELFNSGSGSAAVMFAIGQALQGHVNEEARTIFKASLRFRFSHRPCKTSNRILRGANQSNERCDACMDSCWHQVESCEGREKVDCEIDLGFKRRSVVPSTVSKVSLPCIHSSTRT
jgi:hypothetical protein